MQMKNVASIQSNYLSEFCIDSGDFYMSKMKILKLLLSGMIRVLPDCYHVGNPKTHFLYQRSYHVAKKDIKTTNGSSLEMSRV